MTCGVCRHAWETPAEPPSAPVDCPSCEAHVCACGCGAHLGEMKATARYSTPACRTALERAGWGTTRGARAHVAQTKGSVHPLDEVRARHEESKGRWTTIVREHLNRTLLTTGYVSAEDFDALGIPDEHHNLANAQIGGYVSGKYIEAITWKRSKKASRKSGKFWVFKLTELGRESLSSTAGSSADASSGAVDDVSVGSGGKDSAEDGSPHGADLPTSAEPARLPGLAESAAARHLRDVA